MEQVSPKQSEVVCSAALKCSDKNRFKDHLPCEIRTVVYSHLISSVSIADKYRVILSGEYPDYIHAVSVNVRGHLYWFGVSNDVLICTQGYKQKKAYIIAEGPMESTTRNMWKVICDRKCGAIVMLSDLIENGMVYMSNRLTVVCYNGRHSFPIRKVASNTGQP